jgi:lipoprotein-anchoring transpeptidase ErfK/SrfK
MPKPCTIAVWVALLGLVASGHAAPATVTQSALAALPALRSPLITGSHSPPPILPIPDTDGALAELRAAMQRDVPGQLHLSTARAENLIARAQAMLSATGTAIDTPQLVLTVDRNPGSQTIALFLARPGAAPWSLVGATHVSTGQAGRKDYYITPVGVFRHTDAILDFRAQGTYNEHHVRGLGLAGMRVWDFGWQWALKGWHTDGEGGDIRLQMHATDPTLLERRLGRPASEGCVRLSSAMNRFLDHYGVLDADYDRVAITDIRYRQLLQPDHTPTPLAGRLLIVVDSRDPVDEKPTAASRPANWPLPK